LGVNHLNYTLWLGITQRNNLFVPGTKLTRQNPQCGAALRVLRANVHPSGLGCCQFRAWHESAKGGARWSPSALDGNQVDAIAIAIARPSQGTYSSPNQYRERYAKLPSLPALQFSPIGKTARAWKQRIPFFFSKVHQKSEAKRLLKEFVGM